MTVGRSKTTYHHGDLRAALIAAAETLLAERGVQGFTLRECARRVGVSPAAPAHHFGNAAGLLATITSMGIEELADTMEASLIQTGPSPSSRLQAIAAAYVDFALRRPERFRVMFGTAIPGQHRGNSPSGSADRALQILEREVGGLRPAPSSPRATAVFTWSLVHGISVLLLDDRLSMLMDASDKDRDRDTLISEVIALLNW